MREMTIPRNDDDDAEPSTKKTGEIARFHKLERNDFMSEKRESAVTLAKKKLASIEEFLTPCNLQEGLFQLSTGNMLFIVGNSFDGIRLTVLHISTLVPGRKVKHPCIRQTYISEAKPAHEIIRIREWKESEMNLRGLSNADLYIYKPKSTTDLSIDHSGF
ncbi:hypothetical protein OVA29_21750 [Exiguobacterium sp. SL14]|nr:hypothetical protein [Exiguobacterium sp. SL14]MCY1692743.1 hypothetical protein [Exiguobacterium sp. SL14]